MSLFKSLLVGLDLGATGAALTPGSVLALEQAQIIGRKFGARVLLYHSQATDEHWEPDAERHMIRQHGLSEEGRAALEAARVELTANDIDAHLEITDEKAWLGIIQHVLVESIDLVVVSKRSQRLPDLRHLGSVSAKLLRKCPSAVWAVKGHSALELNNVLVATDLEDCEEKVLAAGAALSREWGATAHVLHTFQLPLEMQMSDTTQSFIEIRRTEVLAHLRNKVTELGGDADATEFHVGMSSPTHAISEVVERCDIDLVVMGSIGRGGPAGVLIGNTAERVFGHVDRSLLVVKPDTFVCPVQSDS